MNGITLTLRALHHGERHLARHLTAVGERHSTDHEVRHVAADLARWSREHADRLDEAARDRDVRLIGLDGTEPPGVLSALREKAAAAVGHRPEPGLLLLWDLRQLHLAASGNSLYWEMLAQAAQAAKDDRLLELASDCHPRTLRQMRWTNTMIKTLSPQVLTAL
ncbi:hypothetical protein [Streptomyces sp. enrichment culture]|uniref:hypothetical protein n=1 Tax=Streptomyces sp. enrichment culture TaxID=1795815 RepID=UPI003F578259